jgi:hypothetical protein
MKWIKYEETCFNEHKLIDNANNHLITIGWEEHYDEQFSMKKYYYVYPDVGLGFLFNRISDQRTTSKAMKNFVEKRIRDWMIEEIKIENS